MTTETQVVPEPLSAEEKADFKRLTAKVKKTEKSVFECAEALKEIRTRRLYRESFKTFEDYVQKTMKISRSFAYRLLAKEAIEGEIVQDPELPKPTSEVQIRALAQVPEGQRQDVYRQAVEAAGGKAPTTKQVKVAVDQHKQAEVEKQKAAEAETPIGEGQAEASTVPVVGGPGPDQSKTFKRKGYGTEEVKKDPILSSSLQKIERAAGLPFVRLIKSGAVELSKKDVRELASCPTDKIRGYARLLEENRWSLARVRRVVSTPIDEHTKVETLLWQCVAENGTVTADFGRGRFKITVQEKRTKK